MILLDTHAWVWLCFEPRRLSAAAAGAIRRATAGGGIAIASITLWEVAMLAVRGRIIPHGTAEAWLSTMVDRSRVTVRDITPAVAAIAAQWPDGFPGDPADRLIAATARAEGLPVVTRDRRLRAAPAVATIW